MCLRISSLPTLRALAAAARVVDTPLTHIAVANIDAIAGAKNDVDDKSKQHSNKKKQNSATNNNSNNNKNDDDEELIALCVDERLLFRRHIAQALRRALVGRLSSLRIVDSISSSSSSSDDASSQDDDDDAVTSESSPCSWAIDADVVPTARRGARRSLWLLMNLVTNSCIIAIVHFVFGVVLALTKLKNDDLLPQQDEERAFSQIDRGPSPDSPQANAFRALWGDRVEVCGSIFYNIHRAKQKLSRYLINCYIFFRCVAASFQRWRCRIVRALD